MIALALMALACPAPQVQSNSLLERLISFGDPVPGLGAGAVILNGDVPIAGSGGGWLARVLHTSQSTAIIGQRPDEIDGPVRLLRQTQTLNGVRQDTFNFATMANGQVAYTARTLDGSPSGLFHTWIEDQVVATSGDAIPGSPGWTWRSPEQIYLTTSGAYYLNGNSFLPNGELIRLIWRWPDQEVLVAEGQSVPGLQGNINDFYGLPAISEDGSNWALRVQETSGRRALLVNGAVHEVAPGYPLIWGAAVPPQIAGSHGPSIWVGFDFRYFVNNRGDFAFRGFLQNTAGEVINVYIRNGRRHSDSPGSGWLSGMDARGALALHRSAGSRIIDVEGYRNVLRNSELDLDGDGVGDPGTAGASFFHSFCEPNARHHAVCLARFLLDSGELGDAYFRARDFRMDVPICEGSDNSTGYPGQLIVCGSQRVSDDEVGIEMFGFPTGSTGFVLASRTPGFVANPGQSQGNLCLSGQIGRLATQSFTVDETGRAAISFDLDSIPTPFGDVAAIPGDRWYVQAWYRDSIAGQATSNFTSASGFRLE